MRLVRLFLTLMVLATIILALPTQGIATATAAGPSDKLNHVIVIYQENWSFD